MFENIIKFFKNIGKKEEKNNGWHGITNLFAQFTSM